MPVYTCTYTYVCACVCVDEYYRKMRHLVQGRVLYWYNRSTSRVPSQHWSPIPVSTGNPRSTYGISLCRCQILLHKQETENNVFLHLYKKREEKNLCSFEIGWKGSWVLTLTFWNANTSFWGRNKHPCLQVFMTRRCLQALDSVTT